MVAQNSLATRGVDVPIHVVEDARATLLHARASVVASGTATVEAALIGNPFLAVYRLSALSYAVASSLVNLPHVSMANLIAGKRVVPELIQDKFTPENVVRSLQPLLEDYAAREQMKQDLSEISAVLRWKMKMDGNSSSIPPENMVKTSIPSAPVGRVIDRATAWVLRFLDGTYRDSKATKIDLHVPDMHG